MQTKSRLLYFSALLCIIETQKQITLKGNQLNVVVIGNFGVSTNDSPVKKAVIDAILNMHQIAPFQLGLNLGNNVLPHGSTVNDFERLDEVFSSVFPLDVIDFDFLTVIGEHDHEGDFDTQIEYHKHRDDRFFLPKRNYVYGSFSNDSDVMLSDDTSIRFMCIDSTPLYQPGMSKQ
ncbi:hypothetical protein RF11_03407 [Thelohanellus kitauei]|uniref:Calcineurin-like phosphoesterase domain-containing protein n=1 Tax=Thelohanellus kitauei TaxID=669202 RepID=A0A0C2MJI5_THEKT|nr:hypothetical protein RF11_03407 [Thelohanellus kitauei]